MTEGQEFIESLIPVKLSDSCPVNFYHDGNLIHFSGVISESGEFVDEVREIGSVKWGSINISTLRIGKVTLHAHCKDELIVFEKAHLRVGASNDVKIVCSVPRAKASNFGSLETWVVPFRRSFDRYGEETVRTTCGSKPTSPQLVTKFRLQSLLPTVDAGGISASPTKSIAQNIPSWSLPVRIFVSYARLDNEAFESLKKVLFPLEREGLATICDDTGILPGECWPKFISTKLEEANIIIPILSSNYIASSYILENEFIPALGRHSSNDALMIPVCFDSFDMNAKGFQFEDIQIFPDPKVPIRSSADPSRIWVEFAQKLRDRITKHFDIGFSTQ